MPGDFAPNEWKEWEALVDLVLDAPADQRSALIAQLSGGDERRQAELQRIVDECEKQYPLLDRPIAERFASLLDDETVRLPEVLAERYRIVRELGRGGMAIVYLATDIKHERDVAVKIVRPSLVATLGRARFLREIAIAAKLKHPHIVPLFDSGEVDGVLYYVMPYQEEQSLRERLRRHIKLPIDDAIGILSDVCDALAHAHGQGIVHRDIKPDNVLLSGRHAMVTDFGVARAMTAASESDILTTAGRVLGTAAYMAPEQATATAAVDYRVDIYAVGVMAYEMLAGERPFTGDTPASQRPGHNVAAALDLTKLRADVPADLAAIVMKCLEADPASRYQRAEEVLVGLERLAPHTRRRPVLPISRRSWKAAATAAAAVGAMALLWSLRPNAAVRTPPPTQPRLAVLVFQHRGSAVLQPLAVALTDNLIRVLGEAGLVVRSLDAVLPYRDGLTPIDSLSRLLNVNWLVGGQLYRRADSTVATAGLTDAVSGRRIDGTEARAAFGDDVRLIEELVPKVAALLRTRVGDQVRVEGWRAGTRSDQAFSAVNWAHKERRDAKQLVARNDIPGAQLHLHRADSALEIAARADERWIEPLIQRALVALTYARSTFASGRSADSARAALQRGKAHALAALRLDRNSPRALEAAGMLLHEEADQLSGGDSSRALRDSAERVLTRASNADTTLVEAASLLSTAHFERGEYDQAYVMAERAYAADAYYRDPHEVLSMLFMYSFEDEEDADARRWCAAYGAMFRDDWYAGQCRLTLMIWDSRESPNADSAWAVARAAIAAAPEVIRPSVRVQVQTLLAGVLARAGAPSNARRVLADVDAAVRADPTVAREPFGNELLEIQAAVRLRLGQTDSASMLLKELLRRDPDRGVRLQRSRRFRDLPFERLRDAVGATR